MSHPTINKVATGFDQSSRAPSVQTAGGAAIATLRACLGFVFLWAFLALTMIVLAVIGAGSYFGLGKWWAGVTGGRHWLR